MSSSDLRSSDRAASSSRSEPGRYWGVEAQKRPPMGRVHSCTCRIRAYVGQWRRPTWSSATIGCFANLIISNSPSTYGGSSGFVRCSVLHPFKPCSRQATASTITRHVSILKGHHTVEEMMLDGATADGASGSGTQVTGMPTKRPLPACATPPRTCMGQVAPPHELVRPSSTAPRCGSTCMPPGPHEPCERTAAEHPTGSGLLTPIEHMPKSQLDATNHECRLLHRFSGCNKQSLACPAEASPCGA